ncbi:carbon storage regulator [Pirellula sp. SH-Sr6A]|uniref:carbon storage regulator n=1 Tax=Pirellula sp. SH-Sr6A TaxID=1632865 RepID=UPI0039656C55
MVNGAKSFNGKLGYLKNSKRISGMKNEAKTNGITKASDRGTLVLQIEKGERFFVGDSEIEISRCGGRKVTVVVRARKEVPVLREKVMRNAS